MADSQGQGIDLVELVAEALCENDASRADGWAAVHRTKARSVVAALRDAGLLSSPSLNRGALEAWTRDPLPDAEHRAAAEALVMCRGFTPEAGISDEDYDEAAAAVQGFVRRWLATGETG